MCTYYRVLCVRSHNNRVAYRCGWREGENKTLRYMGRHQEAVGGLFLYFLFPCLSFGMADFCILFGGL